MIIREITSSYKLKVANKHKQKNKMPCSICKTSGHNKTTCPHRFKVNIFNANPSMDTKTEKKSVKKTSDMPGTKLLIGENTAPKSEKPKVIKMDPLYLDFADMRKKRQHFNNQAVINAIMNENDDEFINSINEKELERTLIDLDVSKEELLSKCKSDIMFCKLLARNISKNASRQGVKDECIQIETCDKAAQMVNIKIVNLPNNKIRPTKSGDIVSKKEMKELDIDKNTCLKSFDAEITGQMTGYISAKVALGSGGHQDNVFEEEDTLAAWWSTYKSGKSEFMVLLIDTDLTIQFEKLKKKYEAFKNILITNHYDFQKYLIGNYKQVDSM